MTKYIFDNSKFRSQLINQLLDGTLKINPDVCQCIYRLNSTTDVVESLKVNVDGNYSAQPCNYATTLSNLGYSIKFLGAGAYGLAGKICQDPDCHLTYAIKIMAFNEDYPEDVDDPNRPENIEIEVIKILNERILLPKMSPHITLYIQHFRCEGLPALWQPRQTAKYDQYVFDVIASGDYKDDTFNVLISELCQYGSLLDFIKNNTSQLTDISLVVIYFQFVYTLAQIQKIIPGFRHNDCHCGNILVQEDDNFKNHPDKFYLYYYDGHYYRLPVYPFLIKFWDFDFANVPGELTNPKPDMIDGESFGYRHTLNPYYDLHLFTNSLMSFVPARLHNTDIFELFEAVVPDAYRGQESSEVSYGRLIPDNNLIDPAEVLNDPYLSSMCEIQQDEINLDEIIDVYGIDLQTVKNNLKKPVTPKAKSPKVASPKPMLPSLSKNKRGYMWVPKQPKKTEVKNPYELPDKIKAPVKHNKRNRQKRRKPKMQWVPKKS